VSVVEKGAPRSLIALGAGAIALIVLLAVIVATVGLRTPDADPAASTSTTQPSSASTSVDRPDATFAPQAPNVPVDVGFDPGASYRIYLHRVESATVHVFAYIDLASGELRYVDERAGAGFVRARIGDTLVVESPDHLGFVDRGLTRESVAVANGTYVGAWRDHAIVADSFPERTTFRVYDRTGREQQSVVLVGRAPDLIAGVVRDSVVVERGGRIILVGLTDSTVRPFAVGDLLGVGGDRIFYTSCTLQGTCAIHEATLDGTVRTSPVGPYTTPSSDRIDAQVAPDGSGVIVYRPRQGGQVLLTGGAQKELTVEGGPHRFAWAPTGRLFVIDRRNHTLDVVDARTGRVDTIALLAEVGRAVSSVAVW
jgi:hypothetical protein